MKTEKPEFKNVIDYVRENGGKTFDELPLSTADALILAQMSYYKFENVQKDGEGHAISWYATDEALPDIIAGMPYQENYTALLKAAAESKRFGSIRAVCQSKHTDRELQTQFSAVTLLIGDRLAYVSFRGTDSTVVGWKEDMNMSFMSCIPSQLESVEYLNVIAGMTARELIVGGHSKGGNLALYAAVMCADPVRERIKKVYVFDGPGFKDDIYSSAGFSAISDRVVKLVPQSSVVGMLMQNLDKYSIVRSDSFWVFQHDAFSWYVSGSDFIYMKNLTVSSSVMDEAVKLWLVDFDENGRKRLVDALYDVFSSTNAVTLSDLSVEWGKNAAKLITAYDGIDKSTKQYLKTIVALLMKYAALCCRDAIKESIEKRLPEKPGRRSVKS